MKSSFISNAAMRRTRAFKLADWFAATGADCGGEWLFIRLSFRDWDAYREGFGLNSKGVPRKGHLQEFLNRLQVDAKRKCGRGCPCLWVVELQGRGVPHYHLILRTPLQLPNRHGKCVPYHIGFPDKPQFRRRGVNGRRVAGTGAWWTAGSTNVLRVRGVDGEARAVGYVLKYIGKDMRAETAELAGWRRYGVAGLTPSMRRARTRMRAPEKVRLVAGDGEIRQSRGDSTWQADPCGWGWVTVWSDYTARPGNINGRAGLIVTGATEDIGRTAAAMHWQRAREAADRAVAALALRCENEALALEGYPPLDRENPWAVLDKARKRLQFIWEVSRPGDCRTCGQLVKGLAVWRGFGEPLRFDKAPPGRLASPIGEARPVSAARPGVGPCPRQGQPGASTLENK